eukprot:4291148-Pleurochrysis_carterae.AAC.1
MDQSPNRLACVRTDRHNGGMGVTRGGGELGGKAKQGQQRIKILQNIFENQVSVDQVLYPGQTIASRWLVRSVPLSVRLGWVPRPRGHRCPSPCPPQKCLCGMCARQSR